MISGSLNLGTNFIRLIQLQNLKLVPYENVQINFCVAGRNNRQQHDPY